MRKLLIPLLAFMGACGDEMVVSEGPLPPPPPPLPPIIPPPPPPPPLGPPATTGGPSNVYTTYAFRGGYHENLEWTFRPVVAPPASLHEKRQRHDYSMQFAVGPRRLPGFAGFQTDGTIGGHRGLGRGIHLVIQHAQDWRTRNGRINRDTRHSYFGCHSCGQIQHSYEWEVGKEYRFRIATGPSVSPERSRWIGLWVTDVEMDSTVYVGEVLTPPNQKLIGSNLTARSDDSHRCPLCQRARHEGRKRLE